MKAFLAILAATATLSTPKDFAYRMEVTGTGDSAAYRIAMPLAVYQKIVRPDLADLRVFNGNGEQVPFAIERPAPGTIADAAAALAIFPLKDDSDATLNAIKVTIESGKGAINVQSGSQGLQSSRISSYLVDGRALDAPVSALRLEWAQDAPDFAGRVNVEESDSLTDWRMVRSAAPVANLHSTAARLVEQRIEFPPAKAKFWRLSWAGPAAPFVLTSVSGEPARQSVDALHASMSVAATAASSASGRANGNAAVETRAGEFQFDLGARVPVDRVNLELPDLNTVVEVELLARDRPQDTWRTVGSRGFYRLKSEGGVLRNGPVPVLTNTSRYWMVRTDPRHGGLGKTAPKLIVEWVPHEVVFIARGAAPFQLAYGSSVAQPAAASLDMLPKNVAIATAALSAPETSGGDSLLLPPTAPFPWKTPLLWAILIAGTGLLGWMAYRLSKEV